MGRKPRTSLDQLETMPLAELKQEWARLYGAPAPALSADLMRLGIAYRLQEQRLGGLSREAKSILRQAARAREAASAGAEAGGGEGPAASKSSHPVPRKLTPGTRLVRDWHGTGHTVTVLEKGFAYAGKEWRSLSAIAKAITGGHWNGPRFFGLSGRGRA